MRVTLSSRVPHGKLSLKSTTLRVESSSSDSEIDTRAGTLKGKLALAIVAGVVASAAVALVAVELGLPLVLAFVTGAVVALALVQLLARGLTRPLREMAGASARMARGDYAVRVDDA